MSDTPSATSLTTKVEAVVLQLGHRAAVLAFLVAVSGWALMFSGKSFFWAFPTAFFSADVGLCCGVLAWCLAGRQARTTRAARGVFWFSFTILLLSVQVLVLTCFFRISPL